MAIPAGRFQAAGSANKCKVSKEFGTLLIINEEDAQMKIQTRYFGEVEIGDEKIVHFDKGLFGFEEYKDYTILMGRNRRFSHGCSQQRSRDWHFQS